MVIPKRNLRSDAAQEILLLIIVTLFWFSQYVYVPYQATYLSSIGVIPSLVGIVVGAYGLSQLILRMPVGLMVDKRGKHRIFIIVGVLSTGIASLFRISFPNEFGFLIANLFSGLAAAMWISFMTLFFTYFDKKELQKASGMILGANNVGILLGFVTGTLLNEHFGMRLLCLLSSAAAIPSFLLALCIKEPRVDFKTPPFRELIQVYTDKRLIVFALLALVQQGIQASTAMAFTAQVAQARGANGVQIGLCSIIFILAAVVSAYFAASKMAQKRGAPFWIPVIMVCLAAYCLLIPNLPTVEWIYFAQILSGLSAGLLFSFCTSEAMKNIPQGKTATATGFYQAIYAFGITTLPILTGAVADALNIRGAFYVLAGIAAAGVVGAILFYRLHPKVCDMDADKEKIEQTEFRD